MACYSAVRHGIVRHMSEDDVPCKREDPFFDNVIPTIIGSPRLDPKREISTRKVNNAIDEAFELIGGIPRFAVWAHNNQDAFYKMWAKTAPRKLDIDANHTVQFLKPSVAASPLDQDFTEADYVDMGESVPATPTLPSLPQSEGEIRGDGVSSASGEDSRLCK